MGSSSPQIKNFIMTSYDYQRKRTDRNLMQIQRQLQILSVVSDLHVFEPTCMETLEFYVCLEKLLTSADGKSTLAWKIITLFAHLSQSQNIRISLRDDIKLVPVLCDFLIASKFSKDKTCKILQLIEAISYKIKIPYAEAWVITLVRYLADVVKSDNSDDLFVPALSILANLCRFNPPALACLRSYAFSKPMVHRLIDMKNASNKEKLLAAEMMLYLHQDFSRVGRNHAQDQVATAVDCIMQAASDGFAENDVSCLQLAADVFAEFAACPSIEERLRGRDYSEFTQAILKYLTSESPESAVEVFLNLLYQIIDLDQPTMQPLYQDIFVKVMAWLKSDQCCLPALRVLRTLIIVDNKFVDSQQVEQFIFALMVSLDMDDAMHLSPQKLNHINSVLLLIEELCNHDTTLRMKMAMNFQVGKFNSLLKLVIGISSTSKCNETLCSAPESSVNSTWRDLEFTSASKRVSKAVLEDRMSQAVLHIMSVVKLLGSHNGDFLIEYDQMLNNPATMVHLVRCQRSSNPELIAKAITVLSNGSLPSASLTAIVSALEESNKSSCNMQDLELSQSARADRSTIACSPDFEARIERMIERLSGTTDKLELKDISLTSVMDMYEYKLATCVHSEETLQTALAAADTRYRQTHLSLLQTQAQTDQLRKLLYAWEERFCVIQQEKAEVQENIAQIQSSSKQFRENLINEKTAIQRLNQDLHKDVKEMKAVIEVREENIRRLQRQLQESQADSKNLHRLIKEEQDKVQKIQGQNQKLEEDLKKGGKDYETLEKECQRLEKLQAELKKENSELELLIHSHEQTMSSKETELEQVSRSYNDLKRIQDLIHNMSGKLGN